jgi:hypothetical protein
MPGEFESILTKLQGKLGKQTIRRASTINRPRPKFEVQQIDIFNKFNRRNPKADGGSADDYEPSAFSKKVNELMDDGYDFGEAVREAMRQGYKKGGLVEIRNRVKKKFPNKKLDFKKHPKYGMPKKDPDYDKARYNPKTRKKRTIKEKKNPKLVEKRRLKALEYYSKEKENILQRAKDRYRSDDLVGKTGKTTKQLQRAKNIDRIIKIQNTIGIFPSGYMKSGNKRFYKPELAVWRDLYDSTTKQGQDRWVLPKQYKNNVPINDLGKPSWGKNSYYKNIKFVDKKTGEIIKLDETIKGKGKTLKEYLDTTIAKETGEKRVFQKAKDGYELKNKIKDTTLTYKGQKETLGGLLAKTGIEKTGEKIYSPFEVHHPSGVKNN